MKKLIYIILLILSPLSTNVMYASNPLEEQQTINNSYVTDLDTALRLSKETRQNLVIIFSASWCVYCQNLRLDLPTIKGFDNKIICILDSDKEKKLARQFKAKALPTSIMLNPNGEEIDRLVGYEKEAYERWLSK